MPPDTAQPYTPYGASRKVWLSHKREVLIPGPAGTGKTRGNLEKAHLACMKYPGCRVLIARKTRKSLTQSVLVTLEDKVFMPDWRRWFGNAKREQRSTYHYPNGSEMVPAGLDDPLKIMSSEWDRVFLFESIEFTEEDYEHILTRMRESHTPYNQLVCDTNPGPSQHWLLKRAMSGKMEKFDSVHEDNPYLFDQQTGKWTKKGQEYLQTLDSLTGNRRQRLLKGVWCADESAVFDMDVLDRHLALCFEPRYCLRVTHALDGASRDMSIRAQKHEDIKISKADIGAGVQNRLLWWGELLQDEHGRLRPPQDRVYVLSADISGGNGASNSVIGIADRNTRTKVGEWVSASISPGGLARMMAMLGLWCGGARKVGHMIWEANYPGPYFGNQLSQVLEYPSLHRRLQGADKTFQTTTQSLGWFNSRPALRDGVEALRDAYACNEFTNPSEAAIQEAMQWLRYPNGGLGPGHLQEESADAKATHGDRVIADLLLVLGMAIDLPTPKSAMQPTGFWDKQRLQALELEPVEDEEGGEVLY